MKKRFIVMSLIFIFSILVLSGCDILAGIPVLGDLTHAHDFVEGKCECGEEDPNYQPPHEHVFVEGKCECGEEDPNYQPPHEHVFVEGKCECGEEDPDYQPPHEHVFIDGKCECGEEDPDYQPPHEHVFVEGKCECGEEDPNYKEEPEVLDPITIYIVGDSTVCAFNDNYYYPRYGYGTQLPGYLADEATVVNLAMSGRSSKSFTTESNYEKLKNEIGEGDYLIIAFGHNDEKSDDVTRFTDASKPYTDESSFGYSLYVNYVKLAIDAGATPILCTPIVRAATDDDYSGSEAHVTATGDYAQAIRDLGAAVDVDVIDLTAITAAEYSAQGFDVIKKYHAVTVGKYDSDGTTVIPNWNSVDKTHLNIYGAKFVAYSLATELARLDGIGSYVLADISAPTDSDLVVNPEYVFSGYTAPELSDFGKQTWFETVTDGWYGTAFGDTGGDPTSASNGYYATETEEGVFKVGQTLSSGSNKGKFSSSSDGFAFLFTQVAADKNFTISVTATILNTGNTKQAGFGLMLRDDCYLPVKDASITSNYLTAGILCDGTSATYACFNRENTKFSKGDSFGTFYDVGDIYTLSIERIGQTVILTVSFGDKTVSTTHYDFDLFAKDNEYMYVGMFANRGTLVEFTDLEFVITGDSQGA